MRRKQSGFTLIELLVAATILAVLTAIALVSYRVATQKSRNARRKADLEQVRAALEIYRTDQGEYPQATGSDAWATMFSSLSGFISANEVTDPQNVDQFVYSYNSDDGTLYSVCACMEPDTGDATACENSYCLNNP